MSQCWYECPADRPSFAVLRNHLESLLSRDVDYLDLDNFDAPLNHSIQPPEIAAASGSAAAAAAGGDHGEDDASPERRATAAGTTAGTSGDGQAGTLHPQMMMFLDIC